MTEATRGLEREQEQVAHGSAVAHAVRRMEAEYREMPGLKLTLAQAQRLWSLDSPTCDAAIRALIGRGFLRRTRQATYVRAA